MTLAEQLFGPSLFCYPGFCVVLLRVEIKNDIRLTNNNLSDYKWEILHAAMEIWPATDVHDMSQVVNEIIGLTYP